MTSTLEPVGTFLAFVITLMVLSYVFGDNPLYRLASYIFVGSSAGYIAAVLIKDVLLVRLQGVTVGGVTANEISMLVVLAIFSLLLLGKVNPTFAFIGNVPMAMIVGVGTAVAISGAVVGTLLPNLMGLGAGASFSQAPIILLSLFGTVATLIYFNFTFLKKESNPKEPPMWMRIFSKIGKFFIMVSLGVVFAGVLTASINALVDGFAFFSEMLRIALNIN
jgi:hypothetical protein